MMGVGGEGLREKKGLEGREWGETNFQDRLWKPLSTQCSRLDFGVDFPGRPEGEAGGWEV